MLIYYHLCLQLKQQQAKKGSLKSLKTHNIWKVNFTKLYFVDGQKITII